MRPEQPVQFCLLVYPDLLEKVDKTDKVLLCDASNRNLDDLTAPKS